MSKARYGICSLAILASMGVMVAGCSASVAGEDAKGAVTGQPAASTATGPVAEVRDLLPSDVLESNVIRIGSREDVPPGTALDADSGEVIGYEVDIMAEVARILGVTFEYSYGDVGGLIPGLQADRYDAANGAFGTNAERQKIADFVSYAASPFAYVALKGNDLAITTTSDLCGLTVATSIGTQAANVAAEQAAKCEADGAEKMVSSTYANTNENLLALRSGRADVYFTPSVTALTAVENDPELEIVGLDAELPAVSLGISFLKGSPLSKAFLAAINHLIEEESETYVEVFERWELPEQFQIERSVLNPEH